MLPTGELPLHLDSPTLVDPAASFRIEIGAEVKDVRLALLDEQDAMVPMNGTTEVGQITRCTLIPIQALRPGTRYTLRIDGAVSREPHSKEGSPFAPLIFQIKTTGDRPPPAAVVKKKGSGGHRRRRR